MANMMNKNFSDASYSPPNDFLAKAILKQKLEKPVYITQPTMPRLQDYVAILKKMWQSKWLTNNGVYHQELEKKLSEYLGAQNCSLFSNGTLALLIVMKALKLKGEVITTPFTFPATSNILEWLNLTPVYADIEEETFNLDPAKIEKLITAKTAAILPVHVFGNPCRVDEIQGIADRYHLKVVYDAAHCMGVKLRGRSVVGHGDASILSFHATKLFTTIEGGAVIVRDENLKKEVEYLKNFGIADEETVLSPGINAKLNEFQSAFGLLQLKKLDEEILKRKKIAALYREKLKDISGLVVQNDLPEVEHNYGYFPVLVEEEKFGLTRDQLYYCLKWFNVYARKYFYPLVSTYAFFESLPSTQPGQLPVAERVAKNILCLPIYGNLELETQKGICEILHFIQNHHFEIKKVLLESH